MDEMLFIKYLNFKSIMISSDFLKKPNRVWPDTYFMIKIRINKSLHYLQLLGSNKTSVMVNQLFKVMIKTMKKV